MKKTFFSLLFFAILTNTNGEVTNAQLADKLDIIINQMNGLDKRVTNLEKKNIEVSNEIKVVSKIAEEAKSESTKFVPVNPEGKKSFFSNLRMQLNSDEVNAKGPWTKKETWNQVKKNLTEFKIRKLLGNPSTTKISIDPRIERVYIYKGDLNADGKEELGNVNFFRERVVSFTSPFN
jgi:hypothetical protein